jgi:LysR family transcriptional regulator, regulator for bpeEF and oprC
MDRFRAMQVFLRVVDTGSFTRAAETLDMPRATVTTAVQSLETRLGVRLLQRTTRRVSVTPDGEAFAARCRIVLEELEQTEAMFSPRQVPAGRLRISLPSRPARLLIVPALRQFCARYPQVELEISISDRPVDLIQEGMDCALRVGSLPDSSLVARRIGSMVEISCASPDYLERLGTPRTPEELATHQAVNYHAARTGRVLPWEYVLNGQSHEITLPGTLTVDNAEAYFAAALAGFGLVQVPLYTAAPHLENGELLEVLPEYRPLPSTISVVYPHSRHLSPRVRVFADWLADTLVKQVGIVA